METEQNIEHVEGDVNVETPPAEAPAEDDNGAEENGEGNGDEE